MGKRHVVELTDEQRQHLERLVGTGRESARKITRARILLKAGVGHTDEAIAAALGVSVATAERVRRRFAEGRAEGGVDPVRAAVERRPQPPRPAKRVLDGEAEARLVTLACGRPPDGYGHWTLDLLADRLVKLNVVPAVSGDTVGRVLKKRNQAVAGGRVVHPRGGGRVRVAHGGRAGRVQAAVRPRAAGGGDRREAGAAGVGRA